MAALAGTNQIDLISNNNLVALSQAMVALTPYLRVFRASYNNIMQIASNNFISVPHLTHLCLHANSLTTWNADVLPNHPNLVELSSWK